MTAPADDTAATHETNTSTARTALTPEAQMRRAWVTLAVASLAFAALAVTAVVGGFWVSRHATEPRTATISLVSGSGLLIRSPGEAEWRLIDGGQSIREGDRISTALGTVVTLTAFDGTTVEIAEDSIVEVHRLRASRFVDRTKLVTLRPERGAVYVNMAPAGEYGYSEVVVEASGTRVIMASERSRQQHGAFIVEIVSPGDAASPDQVDVRAAVLQGGATVTSDDLQMVLTANQQTVVDAGGVAGPITAPVRELVVNGAFEHGMDGWVDYREQSAEFAGVVPMDASVDLVTDRLTDGDVVALEIARPSRDQGGIVEAGVRQRIGKTLHVVTSLRLQFDVRIIDQQPAGGGNDLTQFPLVVELMYVDVEGKERSWSHGYYVVADPERPVDEFRASQIERDTWRRVSFDLSNLRPLPRQITSIVVYASGESYQTRVTNVSLTSGELLRDAAAVKPANRATGADVAAAGGRN